MHISIKFKKISEKLHQENSVKFQQPHVLYAFGSVMRKLRLFSEDFIMLVSPENCLHTEAIKQIKTIRDRETGQKRREEKRRDGSESRKLLSQLLYTVSLNFINS